MKKLRIACDIDDTVLNWTKAHESFFNVKVKELTFNQIAEQVASVKNNKTFWTSLELLEKPNFIPACYITKRMNPNSYTRENLKKVGLPGAKVYKVDYINGRKSDYRKYFDILIDDDWNNVQECLNHGVCALLINRPHNAHIETDWRINDFNLITITEKYHEFIRRKM